MQLQGERERHRERKVERGRERERACNDYHAISVNPKGAGSAAIDCFPHVRPGEQPLPPFFLPLQPQLLSLRAACFVGLGARRAANDANGLNAAQSISSSLRYASSPSVVQ